MITGEYKDVVEKERRSEKDWDDLFSMPVWEEFMDTLHVRLALSRDELEREEDVAELHKLQGDVRTLRYVLSLPSLIKSEFATQRSEKENK